VARRGGAARVNVRRFSLLFAVGARCLVYVLVGMGDEGAPPQPGPQGAGTAAPPSSSSAVALAAPATVFDAEGGPSAGISGTLYSCTVAADAQDPSDSSERLPPAAVAMAGATLVRPGDVVPRTAGLRDARGRTVKDDPLGRITADDFIVAHGLRRVAVDGGGAAAAARPPAGAPPGPAPAAPGGRPAAPPPPPPPALAPPPPGSRAPTGPTS